MISSNILEVIGHTPLIRLNRMVDEDSAEILVKFEGLNVGGSIKTRTAYNMIKYAEEEGLINKDTIIVEPTSGNQGIGLALIGAVKAYEQVSGEIVSDKVLDTAMDEMITTGEIAEGENSEEIEELIAFIKAKLAAGELATDQDIQEAIKEGEEKFSVSLTDEEKEKILQVMHKIKELGLDPEKLLDQAKDLYAKYGDELINNAEEVIKKSFKDSVSNFFSDMGSTVKNFFTNLFS